MIAFETFVEHSKSNSIQSIDISSFSAQDVLNIILQRSEIVNDQHRPGSYIRKWMEGDSSPALGLVDKMGDELVYRALAIIELEYLEIAPIIDLIKPKHVVDIGCGYAFFDLFLFRDHASDFSLIDLESNDERHFGFAEVGAAYSSLLVAKDFLMKNGVPASDITCVNPKVLDPLNLPACNLAVSFLSCGFHYPWETYDTFFQKNVNRGGGIILDVRGRKVKRALNDLRTLGRTCVVEKSANGNARRILVARSGI
ncbi:MAG: hypothetical protein AAF198_07915 [Pseudomonadota bacterium]